MQYYSNHHKPLTPDRGDDLLALLLVDPNTESTLAWSLLDRVNLAGEVNGKPILQLFCELHSRKHVFRAPIDAPFPCSRDEPWPTPLKKDGKWHNASMWIAASLIVNSPDPFVWKDDNGMDVLDHVAKWGNDHLLNQLMRIDGCPSIRELEKRRTLEADNASQPWVHDAAGGGGHIFLQELLVQGFDVNGLNNEGGAPIHVARSPAILEVLFEHGVDIWKEDAAGNLAFTAWLGRNTSGKDPYIFSMISAWCKEAMRQDPERARKVLEPFVFHCVDKKCDSIARNISYHTGIKIMDCMGPGGVSVMGSVAISTVKTPSEDNKERLALYARGTSVERAMHCSFRDIPDIALVFASMLQKRTNFRVAPDHDFMKLLSTMGLDEVSANDLKWNVVEKLGRIDPLPGKKANIGINDALSEYVAWVCRPLKDKALIKELGLCPDRLLAMATDRIDRRATSSLMGLAVLVADEYPPDKFVGFLDRIIDLSLKSGADQYITTMEGLFEKGIYPGREAFDRLRKLDDKRIEPLVALASAHLLHTEVPQGKITKPMVSRRL